MRLAGRRRRSLAATAIVALTAGVGFVARATALEPPPTVSIPTVSVPQPPPVQIPPIAFPSPPPVEVPPTPAVSVPGTPSPVPPPDTVSSAPSDAPTSSPTSTTSADNSAATTLVQSATTSAATPPSRRSIAPTVTGRPQRVHQQSQVVKALAYSSGHPTVTLGTQRSTGPAPNVSRRPRHSPHRVRGLTPQLQSGLGPVPRTPRVLPAADAAFRPPTRDARAQARAGHARRNTAIVAIASMLGALSAIAAGLQFFERRRI
jgi:hypothetical protein